MAVRPVVDAVEREFAGALKVIRVNVQEPVGRQVAATYGLEFTPTFLLFDSEGRQVWRSVYRLDPAEIRPYLSGS